MRSAEGKLVLSATDLAHFLSCRHLIALEMAHALGKRSRPPARDDPTVDLLIERGKDHEKQYVEQLSVGGRMVFDAQGFGSNGTSAEKIGRTVQAIREGCDIIVQGGLGDDRWFGIADIIHRVETPVHSVPGHTRSPTPSSPAKRAPRRSCSWRSTRS